MSREKLPPMSDDQFNRVAFVYRSKDKKLKAIDKIRVVGTHHAKVYEDSPDWEHLATLDSFRWIECLLNNSPKERNEQIRLLNSYKP